MEISLKIVAMELKVNDRAAGSLHLQDYQQTIKILVASKNI
jgi:hypothetical protein